MVWPKSMKNRDKIPARKSDAENQEEHEKRRPDGSQNPVKIEESAIKKEVLKNIAKKH